MVTQRYTQQRSFRQMSAKCRLKVLQNAPGAFCNTFDLHYVIIGLDKTNNLSFVEWPLKTGLTVYN